MKYPVVEIFGPVIQGEGVMAGEQTYFLRLGGCDYRCKWCDTLYAVLPDQVKMNSTPMTWEQIHEALKDKDKDIGLKTLTISGGNPAMWDLSPLTGVLSAEGWKLVAETQGSIWREWFLHLDVLTVSPKPPSSGMLTDYHKLAEILGAAKDHWKTVCVKIVIFDYEDFLWASDLFQYYEGWPRFTFYVQPGTSQHWPNAGDIHKLRRDLLDRTELVTSWVLESPHLRHVRVMPQIHSLIYGLARGV